VESVGRTCLAALGGLGLCWALAGCGEKPAKTAAPVKPAVVEAIGHETELLKLTLTPEAETRLGLQTVAVGTATVRQVRPVHGEVVVAPFAGGVPTSSTTDLATLGANQARADGDVGRLLAELQVAERAYTRAATLVQEEAGSVRARDEAEAALGAVRANLAAARAQRALLGPPIASMNRQVGLWVRAAAFASDLGGLDRAAPATVRSLGPEGGSQSATPVNAPPSANPTAGTVDLYYALPKGAAQFRVGQRVAVDLPALGQSGDMTAPASAVLRDIYGGEWVYVRTAPRTYERRRVEIGATRGGAVQIVRGVTPGAEVVVAGAMELYGSEFGSK